MEITMRRTLSVFALSAACAARLAAECCFVEFSPQPAVAGQAIQATYHGVAPGCLEDGTMQVAHVTEDRLFLDAEPPGCPILPCCEAEYTASTTLPPLAAGTYTVHVREGTSPNVSPSRAITTLTVLPPPACAATDSSLCLNNGRFAVRTVAAHAVPPERGRAGLTDSGLLWFFRPENHEVLVKVLAGCQVNGQYWVFISAATTVEYELVIEDVAHGNTREYTKALGTTPRLTADVNAFPCD
jgi:hypothetical protein